MKLIIAGGRNYKFTQADLDFLDNLNDDGPITEVVSGGAAGADQGGEDWARFNNIPVKVFNAEWKKLGKRAGPFRNCEMARYADAVVLFPGGKGTNSMRHHAKKASIKIYDNR